MQTRDQAFLGTEPVGRLLMRLAIPTVIAQLGNMLTGGPIMVQRLGDLLKG